MSVACPWNPPEGWWIMMRAFGKANLGSLAPAAGGALARREGAGGVPRSKSKSNRETHAALAKEEEHVLRCVDAVVIMH